LAERRAYNRKVEAFEPNPPVIDYDRFSAREAMRIILGLPLSTLERLHTYEDLHQRRTSVLRAIRRAIDRHRRR
jgi:hypothetical protein